MKNRKALIILASAFLVGCDSAEPDYWEPTVHTATPLETVPYDAIGSGKIVFKRNNPDAVYVIDADTRTSWGFTGGVFHEPCVSPDGEKIAFTRSGGETNFDVFVADTRGNDLRNMFPLPWPHQAYAPSWTPHGRHIVYFTGHSVYVDTARVQLDFFPYSHLRISASTTLDLLITAYYEVYRLNSGSSTSELWIAPPAGVTFSSYTVAAWSPDEDQIAYAWIRKTGTQHNLELWIMDEDRTNNRLIATRSARDPDTGGAFSIAWSPDGSRIAISVPEPEVEFVSHIYIATTDGSGLTQLTTAMGVLDSSVSWSR